MLLKLYVDYTLLRESQTSLHTGGKALAFLVPVWTGRNFFLRTNASRDGLLTDNNGLRRLITTLITPEIITHRALVSSM
jgi:hypothetical protein